MLCLPLTRRHAAHASCSHGGARLAVPACAWRLPQQATPHISVCLETHPTPSEPGVASHLSAQIAGIDAAVGARTTRSAACGLFLHACTRVKPLASVCWPTRAAVSAPCVTHLHVRACTHRMCHTWSTGQAGLALGSRGGPDRCAPRTGLVLFGCGMGPVSVW